MRKFLITLSLLISIFSFSQETTNKDEKPYIEVTGTASKFVIPDKIHISVTLSEKVVDKKTFSLDEQESKLKSILKLLNIESKDIFLSDSNSEITKRKQKEIGFKVVKEFTFIVKNAEEVSKVFSELYKQDFKEIEITKTDHSEIDKIRKEVRIEAIKAAKEKAMYLTEAIGNQIVRPLIVREENQNTFYNNRINQYSNSYIPSDVKNEISFEKIEIKFFYYIKYELK